MRKISEQNKQQQTIQALNTKQVNDDIPIFSTNNVLIHKKKQTEITVYLPGYLRVKFKNFLDIDLQNLTSQINATLIFNIYYGDLFLFDPRFDQLSDYLSNKGEQQTYRQQLIQQLMTQLKLNFSRDQAILLSKFTGDQQNLQIDVKHQQKDHQVKFTVRKAFHVHLDGDLRWSPFQVINSILEITVQPISFKLGKTNFTFKINLMDHYDDQLKLSFGQDRTFAYYGLALKKAKTSYTNIKIEKAQQFYMSVRERAQFLKKKNKQQIKKQQKKQKQIKKQQKNQKNQKKDPDIKYFQYSLFNIPMYKYPLTSFVTVFIPLWLLGLINLGIYFQDGTLSDRIASIIALMIAFIAYIPTIEQAIPPSSNMVFMEGMVYAQSFASICTFIHSIRIRDEGTDFVLNWAQTPQYLITFIITVGSFLLVMALMLTHYLYWERKLYNQSKKQKNQRIKQLKNSGKWQFSQQNAQYAIVHGAFFSPNSHIPLKKSKKMFDRSQWSNLASDLYFNSYFYGRRKQVLKRKNSEQKEIKQVDKFKQFEQKKFYELFILEYRPRPLVQDQLKILAERGSQTSSILNSIIR